MGGHAAWKKRVARGELAKVSGGAICRHRPHLGRKGKDLILNRKGHIAGGNPKKKKKHKDELGPLNNDHKDSMKKSSEKSKLPLVFLLVGTPIASLLCYLLIYSRDIILHVPMRWELRTK